MIRMTADHYRAVINDLHRPHAFAGERVGFLFSGIGNCAEGSRLALIKTYMPVSDADYMKDHRVGAAINAHAIRQARQHSLDTGDGIFHVHAHYGRGIPRFSSVDLGGYRAMVPSFIPVAINAAHGAILFSEDNATSLIWWPGQTDAIAAPVRVVGFPMKFFGES